MAKKKPDGRQRNTRHKKSVSPDLFENVHKTKIRVIGVGGGGGSIVAEIAVPLQKFDFIGANTDVQALKALPKKVKALSFGQDLTSGLGCGMDAELGERAAKAEKDKIKKLLEGSDITILIACLGGGTGSGATPTFAEVSQGLRSLTIGIFTMPFSFEGERRKQIAETALEKIKPYVNAYVVIPNEAIFKVIDEKTGLKPALSAVNRRLAGTLEGFMDTLALPGLINIDFADVRSILEGRGRLAYINSAAAGGATKVQEVLYGVVANPLYEYDMTGADRVLFNVTGDRNLKMQEVAQISKAISDHNTKARIIFGMSCSSRLKERIKVTLFAVGCEPDGKKAKKEKHEPTGEKGIKKMQKKPTATRRRARSRRARLPATPSPDVGGLAGKPKQEASGGVAHEKKSAKGEKPVQESRVRRSALEVKRAVDEEMKELEKKEKEWDIPAFLRNK